MVKLFAEKWYLVLKFVVSIQCTGLIAGNLYSNYITVIHSRFRIRVFLLYKRRELALIRRLSRLLHGVFSMRKFKVVSPYEPSGDQVSKSASLQILNPGFEIKTRPVKAALRGFSLGVS